MFYSSGANHAYNLLIASEDWLHGADFSTYPAQNWQDIRYWTPLGLLDRDLARTETSTEIETWLRNFQWEVTHNTSIFERLDSTACIDAYAHDYLSERTDVVLISERTYEYAGNNSVTEIKNLTLYAYKRFYAPSEFNDFEWLCNHESVGDRRCDIGKAREKAATGNWVIFGFNVTSCLSRKEKEACSVNFSLVIAIIVIITNLGKAVCIASVCFLLNDQPLLTIGDAVNSFMRLRDCSTEGLGLITKRDIRENQQVLRKVGVAKPFLPQGLRRWKIAGTPNWASFLLS